jgi:hypothetical protein
MAITELAKRLIALRYPNIERCALHALVRDGTNYGCGPHHEQLRDRGLATVEPYTEAHAWGSPMYLVRLTDMGRQVEAEIRRLEVEDNDGL